MCVCVWGGGGGGVRVRVRVMSDLGAPSLFWDFLCLFNM